MAAGKPTLVTQLEQPRGAAISFDAQAFDQAIQSQGVKLVHFRAMKCPVGLTDRFDARRPHEDHSGCSNGFIYTKAGELTALFTGNSRSPEQKDVGVIDGSTVQVTVQRTYDNTETPVHVAPFDRMYLAEEVIMVPTWQTFEASITGKEKLSFPVEQVQDLMDSDGRRYVEGNDFDVERGYIIWKGARPTYDAGLQRGQICSVRYLYRPYWYVKQMIHQVRVAQVEDSFTGERGVIRMPQAMVLQREYVFEKDDSTPPGEENPREPLAPEGGVFGPR